MKTNLVGAVVEPIDAAEVGSLALERWEENASGERLALIVAVERIPNGTLWLTCRGLSARLFEVPAAQVRVKRLG